MQSAFRKSAWASAGSKPPYEPYTREIWPGGDAPMCGIKGRSPVTKMGRHCFRDLTTKRGLCSVT